MLARRQGHAPVTPAEAHRQRQYEAIATVIVAGERDSEQIALKLGITPRHVRRIVAEPGFWPQYVQLRDAAVGERLEDIGRLWFARRQSY